MNNDETQLNKSNNQVYKASSNLNIAMENPSIDVDSVVGVNIENNVNSNEFNSYNGNYDSNVSVDINKKSIDNNINRDFVNNNIVNNNNNNTENTNEFVNYEPVYQKKDDSSGFSNKIFSSKELKLAIVIAFVLFIFIMLLPYLFDGLNKLIVIIAGN